MGQCPRRASSERQTKSGHTRVGVNRQSVVNRVNAYHAGLPAAGQAVTKPETLEMDELFTFVGSKKRRRTS